MAWDFHVGQRVQCIADFQWAAALYPAITFPSKGSIYTIRAIVSADEALGLHLAEIVNCVLYLRHWKTGEYFATGESAFDASDFRPLDEGRLDSLRALLAPKDPEPAVRRPERERA